MQVLVHIALKQALQRNGKVTLGPLTTALMSSAPVNLQPAQVASTAKFVMMYVGQPHHQLIEDLLQMHAAYVDPQELSVPASAFEACSNESKGFKAAPHLARAIIMALWDTETAIVKQRPIPDTANLLTQLDIYNLAKNITLVKAAEAWLANARAERLPLLQRTFCAQRSLG